jgi:hypothetical protein
MAYASRTPLGHQISLHSVSIPIKPRLADPSARAGSTVTAQ